MGNATSQDTTEHLRCPACDYDLMGLPENRCPECGNTFDREELRAREQEIKPIGLLDVCLGLCIVPILSSALFVLMAKYGDIGILILIFLSTPLVIGLASGKLAFRATAGGFKRRGHPRRGLGYVLIMAGLFLLFAVIQLALCLAILRTLAMLRCLPELDGWS